MNGGRMNMSPTEWMHMDLFQREAYKLAYNAYAKEENKKQQNMQSQLDKKLEDAKEYKSPFAGVTKPTFIN
jgi:Asp-tRNA(Asn)/Glu-tRNA(Gln) amidotransferase A subunit family amidase